MKTVAGITAASITLVILISAAVKAALSALLPGVHSGENTAGAGLMQFLPASFNRVGARLTRGPAGA